MSKVKLCISLELPMFEFRTGHFILRTDVYSYLCCMYQLNIRFMIIFSRFLLFSVNLYVMTYRAVPIPSCGFYTSQSPFPSKQNAFSTLFNAMFWTQFKEWKHFQKIVLATNHVRNNFQRNIIPNIIHSVCMYGNRLLE